MLTQPTTETGYRRICIKGTSGVGKTTLASQVATLLGLTHIELDGLHHGPNWSAPTAQEFRTRVQDALDAAPDGWVIDGNYDSKLDGVVLEAADTIVWLDLSLHVTYGRLWRRTMHRVRNKVELWNGNRETWRDQFASRDSLFIWTIRAHRKHRRTWPQRFGNDPRFVRLRSDEEVKAWLAELRKSAVGHEASFRENVPANPEPSHR